MGQLSLVEPTEDDGVVRGANIGGGMNPEREICKRILFESCVTTIGGTVVVVVVVVAAPSMLNHRVKSKIVLLY